jgi:hypothetical protein
MATAGLSAYWRMDDSTVVHDTFTAADNTLLQNRSGETGASWTKWSASTADAEITNVNRVRKSTTNGFGQYYASGVPTSADYAVSAKVTVKSMIDTVGLVGRWDTTNANGTYYMAWYNNVSTYLELVKVVNGTTTQLGTSASPTLADNDRLTLSMIGSNISLYINNVSVVSAVDSSITAAGRAGMRFGYVGSTVNTVQDQGGMHFDDFAVHYTMADSKGSNDGFYNNNVTLGATSALNGDADTAATFASAGLSVAVAPDATALDVGDVFSLEAWVKRADNATGMQTIATKGSGTFKWGFKNNQIGLFQSNGTTIVQSTTSQTDMTAFHHYVVTKNGATVKLYVDGVDVTGTVTNATLTDNGSALYIGGTGSSEYLNATVDELAVYKATALSSATVTAHYNAR